MNKEKSFTLHEQPEIDQPDQPEIDGMLQILSGNPCLENKYMNLKIYFILLYEST